MALRKEDLCNYAPDTPPGLFFSSPHSLDRKHSPSSRPVQSRKEETRKNSHGTPLDTNGPFIVLFIHLPILGGQRSDGEEIRAREMGPLKNYYVQPAAAACGRKDSERATADPQSPHNNSGSRWSKRSSGWTYGQFLSLGEDHHVNFPQVKEELPLCGTCQPTIHGHQPPSTTHSLLRDCCATNGQHLTKEFPPLFPLCDNQWASRVTAPYLWCG